MILLPLLSEAQERLNIRKFALRRMLHCNQQQKHFYIDVILINGKIILLHFLYISVPYIDTEARKFDSLPYAVIKKYSCHSHPFLGLLRFLL